MKTPILRKDLFDTAYNAYYQGFYTIGVLDLGERINKTV